MESKSDCVTGVDGFKKGWRAVFHWPSRGTWTMRDFGTFAELMSAAEAPKVVCVDMPIGMPDFTPSGGRACEREARARLGARQSSVFSVVGRKALSQTSRTDAHALSIASGGIGIGAQSWGLASKLREVDRFITPEHRQLVFEVHPELSFWAMNDHHPMSHNKKRPEGQRERIAALSRSGVPADFLENTVRALRSGRDDFLDACAATWTARRITQGAGERLPPLCEVDGRGLDMAMWF